jgi:predicted RNase H-like nuclease (RuvC/YqgF family)
VSKGDLRVQIEKLEQVNAKLRSKSREAAREAKLSANRIAELEQQVAKLERRLKPKAAPVEPPAKPSKTKNSKQRHLAAAGRRAPSGSVSAATTLPEQAAETAGGGESGAS